MSQRTIVRYRNLELLCKPDTVSKYRDGKISFDRVVLAEEIYTSVQKGNRAKELELSSVFGTTNLRECMETMLQKGTFQVSAAERKERLEAKRGEIIQYITRNYLDSRNKLPIPVSRVEAALAQIKVRIDPDTPTDKLLSQIMKKLPSVMPITKQKGLHGALRVPHKYCGSVQGIIRKYGTIDSERYDSAGAILEVTVSGSDADTFLKAVSSATNDTAHFDTITEQN